MVYPMLRASSWIIGVAVFAGLFTHSGMAQKKEQEQRGRKIVTRVAPVYSDLAKQLHVGGVVKLEVIVRSDGTVKSTRVVGGNPVLINSATDAVAKWKFEPASAETDEALQLTFDPR